MGVLALEMDREDKEARFNVPTAMYVAEAKSTAAGIDRYRTGRVGTPMGLQDVVHEARLAEGREQLEAMAEAQRLRRFELSRVRAKAEIDAILEKNLTQRREDAKAQG